MPSDLVVQMVRWWFLDGGRNYASGVVTPFGRGVDAFQTGIEHSVNALSTCS